MGNFIYYLPKEENVNGKILSKFGLSYLGDKIAQRAIRQKAVDGGGGMLVARSKGQKTLLIEYKPDNQEWRKVKKDDNLEYWVGINLDDKPRPEDLEKDEIVGGFKVPLLDGNKWTIPMARIFPNGTAFPEYLMLGENGEIISEVLPEFIAKSKLAEEVWDDLVENKKEYDLKKKWDLCIDILKINYHISEDEISLLKIFGTINLNTILFAFIDLVDWLKEAPEEEKKKVLGE